MAGPRVVRLTRRPHRGVMPDAQVVINAEGTLVVIDRQGFAPRRPTVDELRKAVPVR